MQLRAWAARMSGVRGARCAPLAACAWQSTQRASQRVPTRFSLSFTKLISAGFYRLLFLLSRLLLHSSLLCSRLCLISAFCSSCVTLTQHLSKTPNTLHFISKIFSALCLIYEARICTSNPYKYTSIKSKWYLCIFLYCNDKNISVFIQYCIKRCRDLLCTIFINTSK